MARPGSIVVGTDGSKRAERAVDRAGELASLLGVKVHVVSAYSKDSDVPRMAPAVRGRAAEIHDPPDAATRAQHNIDRAQRRLARAGAESDAHIWLGEPAEALLHVANEQDAQMIIVGNRGMTGARRVLGSVPNHVSHHARCDVLIVETA